MTKPRVKGLVDRGFAEFVEDDSNPDKIYFDTTIAGDDFTHEEFMEDFALRKEISFRLENGKTISRYTHKLPFYYNIFMVEGDKKVYRSLSKALRAAGFDLDSYC